ncbi:MAG: DUF2218 domain-containing protein [Pseudomonadota bacterium]
MHATATFQTQHATRHLAALCQHFATKVAVTFTASAGHVAFPFGHCELTADDRCLMLNASAGDADQLHLVIDVVTRHLERFAFRENPDLDWDIPSQPHSQTSSKETHR